MDPKDKKLLRLLLLLFLFLTLGIGWLAEFIIQSFPLSPLRIGLRIVCILADLLIMARILHLLLLRAQLSTRRQRMAMVLGGFFFIVLVLEIPFMFIPYSHGNGNTYSSRIWFNVHWKENSLGFRDREPTPEMDHAKVKLMVLGDSFVAGHGIEDPADRFTDQLARELGGGYAVYNLGKNGADTKDELETLRNFPVKPDILVLSHIPNDIERTSLGSGKPIGMRLERPLPKAKAGIGFLSFLVKGSFVLNYGFWKFNALLEGKKNASIQEKPEDFGGDIIQRYFDPAARREHEADLKGIVDWSRANGVKLLVMTFPEMYDGGIDFTHSEINVPLQQWLEGMGVPTVDTYRSLKSILERDRIVNYNDMHPSVLAHNTIARLLYAKLKTLGWVE